MGCSGPPAVNAPERVPLRQLAIFYGKYRSSHQGQPPKDEAQFKQYIKGLDARHLSTAGLTLAEVDSLFVSPRDGQPYDVRYGAPPPTEGPDGPVAVVAERVGKGGRRFVAYSTGKVEEIDETQYQKVRFTSS
jgi:hypothetical protein